MARATATGSSKKKYSDDSCCEARSAPREAPVSVQIEVCEVAVSFIHPILGLEFSKRRRIIQKRAKHIHDLIDTLKRKAFLLNPEGERMGFPPLNLWIKFRFSHIHQCACSQCVLSHNIIETKSFIDRFETISPQVMCSETNPSDDA